MKSNHPFLQQLLDKHRLAIQNNAKDIRFTMRELNDIVLDLIALITSVEQKHDDNSELKNLINSLIVELKMLNESETDAGNFK